MEAPISPVAPISTARISLGTLTDVAVIAMLWFLSSAIVNPIGEFPLNDDWSYAVAVNRMLDTGEFRPLGWASMTLLSHILWGSIFCLPTECSFTVLRLSTLIASLAGLIGIYVLVRDLQQPRWYALCTTLVVAFNPIYFSTSYTFLTDIPFTAMAIWAVVFLSRSLSSSSNKQMIVGAVLALAATLSRQLALCIPLAYALMVLFRSGIAPRPLLRAIFPLILCFGAYVALNYWLMTNDRLPVEQYGKAGVIRSVLTHPKLLFSFPLANFFVAMTYLGLFLLPIFIFSMKDFLSLSRIAQCWQSGRNAVAASIAAPTLITALGLLFVATNIVGSTYSVLMPQPLGGNILTNSGTGPKNLRDVSILMLDNVATLPFGFWVVVTVIGFTGAAFLIVKIGVHTGELASRLVHKNPVDDIEVVGMFLLLCTFIYLLPILALGPLLYDRYFILATILLATGIAGISGRVSEFYLATFRSARLVAVVIVLGFALFGIFGTRDYLAWNRVRWAALNELMQDGNVSANKIDGGMEFNGLYFYDPEYFRSYDGTSTHIKENGARSWYWVQDDTYQVAFGPVPGYSTVKRYTYLNWLPWHQQEVLILRKE